MVGIKVVRIPSPELFDIEFENILQAVANGVGCERQIPRDIAQFLGHLILIKIVALEKVLLVEILTLASFTAEPQNDDSAYPSVSGRVFSFLAGVILETFLRIRFAELVEPNTLLATAAQKPA